MIKKHDILILGGGPAGLAYANKFKKEGKDFLLLEGKDRVGGNCFTYKEDGFLFDSGAHRLHDKNKKVTEKVKALLGTDLLKVNRPSSIYSEGEFFTFPIKPTEVLKKLGWLKSMKVLQENVFSKQDNSSFGSEALSRYGKTIANRFLLNYSKKLWGVSTFDLVPEVSGKRLGGISLIDTFKETFFNKSAKHIDGEFYYPKQGIYQLFDRMYEEVKESCELNSFITSISKNKDGFLISVKDEKYQCKELYSSLPIMALSNLLSSEIQLPYRHLKLLFLKLDLPQLTDKATLYFPEDKYSFTRITEPKNRSPFLAPENQTSLAIELPYFKGDSIEVLSDEELSEKIISELPSFIPRDKIIGFVVKTIANAYPVLTIDSKKKMKELTDEVQQINGLNLIGRSGKFEYLHIHDLLAV